jgi:pimeloyl-ACP methyl ester carboxylesterase
MQQLCRSNRRTFTRMRDIVRIYALLLVWVVGGCAAQHRTMAEAVPPTPQLQGIARERREIRFPSQGTMLAAELDMPEADAPPALVFVIHHSGAVQRDAYGYLAEVLLPAGYAVFRFDKRGTGTSEGQYGCCESDDALAAYRAAVAQPGIDRCNVFIVAQSIGTTYLAARFSEYENILRPRGVVLLSNLVRADEIGAISVPVHIIVSDSEPELQAIGYQAAAAHQKYGYETSIYIADHTEHTLFDVQAGPIDWNDPGWTRRYHRGAMNSLIAWLNEHCVIPDACTTAGKKKGVQFR